MLDTHIRRYFFLQPQDTVIAKKISEEGQHPEYLEGDGNTDRLRASEYPREEKQVTITTGWFSARSMCYSIEYAEIYRLFYYAEQN